MDFFALHDLIALFIKISSSPATVMLRN